MPSTILLQSNLEFLFTLQHKSGGKTAKKWISVFFPLFAPDSFLQQFVVTRFCEHVAIKTLAERRYHILCVHIYARLCQKERPRTQKQSRCVWLNMSMLINIPVLCLLFVYIFCSAAPAASLPFCCFNQLGNRCGTQKHLCLSHLKQNVESVSGNQHFTPTVSLSCLIQNQLLHFDLRAMCGKWNKYWMCIFPADHQPQKASALTCGC